MINSPSVGWKFSAAAVAVLALAGCTGGAPKAAAAPAAASATSSAPAPAIHASTPPPAPTTNTPAPAPVVSTSADSCASTEDLIERDVVPGQQATAFTLGDRGFSQGKCQSTVDSLPDTVAKEPGYCSQLTRAADNPGYNVDAVPAAPLLKVIAQAGPGC